MKYTIDSTNKSIGRVASEAATVLMGKKTTGYARNIIAPVEVHITNAAKVKMSSKKLSDTVFKHHTGYRGGLKEMALSQFLKEKGYRELFRKTVYGMLPTNKLRPKMIKNLYITE
ncbi:MAG: uL13 family ribosomal protein [Patescibacteria group bacterium]